MAKKVEKKKIVKKHCKHEGCFSKCAPKRRECFKHRSRRLRAAKPIYACFYTLKMNAKRRKLEFSITLASFTKLVTKTGYMENKGRLADSLTIDRKENLLGYIPGNLKIMTKSANVTKFHAEDARREIGSLVDGDIPF